eukprot:scaffold3863_cov263-Chaetoceros_neogracile.AAC.5
MPSYAMLLTAFAITQYCNGLNLNQSSQRSRSQIMCDVSRRNAILSISTFGIASTISPISSFAAPTMTVKEAESPAARFERKKRKAPPKLLRPALNLDFAVLLMRSSYNAIDEIDCVAMDQFQKDFFFIRQAEYLPYTDALGPGLIKQGDLSDPYYFDFISFAQYATVYRDITIDPPMVFEEEQPITVGEEEKQQFISKVIRRDPSLDNSLLAKRHDELVGEMILDKLVETFGNTTSAIPVIDSKSTSGEVQVSLQQLVNLFLINGFAFNGKVEIKKEGIGGGASGTQLDITLTSPANIWSGRALQLKKAFPTNDFVLKTAKVLLKRAGYVVTSSSVKYTSSEEMSSLSIR